MTEAQIQSQLIEWFILAHKGLGLADPRVLYAIPNGAYFGAGVKVSRGGKSVSLGAIRFKQLKKQGLVQGIPDLCLATPRIHSGRTFGALYVEMKKPKGRASDVQLDVCDVLRAAGNSVHVAVGFDEAVNLIVGYLGGQKLPTQK